MTGPWEMHNFITFHLPSRHRNASYFNSQDTALTLPWDQVLSYRS